MTTHKPSPLVPRLRFPEFRDDSTWLVSELGDLATITSGGTPSKNVSEYWNGHIPWISAASMYDTNLHDSERKVTALSIGNGTRIAKAGSLLILTRGSTLYNRVPIGIASIDVAFNQDVRALKIDATLNCYFLLYQLIAIESLIPINDTGIGAGKIDTEDLRRLPVVFPTLAEQQKIADCLGSLDDLIAAESRKLEALRRHKKGLMQQLFPQPCETVPRLRFPEFRDGPTWMAPELFDLYRFKPTNSLSRDNLNYETGTIKNIHYGDIHTKFMPLFRAGEENVPYVNLDAIAYEFDDEAFCTEGDIVLADASEDLNDVGKAIEVVSLGGERVVAGTHTILGTRRGIVPVVGFGGQLFQSSSVRTGIRKEAHGTKVYGISAKRISSVTVPIPPTTVEQKKIADCLGSLDDLITAEDQKLEALRLHKQGLMQQLFPNLEEK